MHRLLNLPFLAALLAGTTPVAAAITVEHVAAPAPSVHLPLHVGGRVSPEPAAAGTLLRQWPGTYFETEFRGTEASFTLGSGDVILHVLVDGEKAATLIKPQPGTYAVRGLGKGRHSLRIEVASESQAGPTVFSGFHAGEGVKGRTPKARKRQIEFIGDSHTVGYGNTSSTRDCTGEQVWATTDTSLSFAARVGRRYEADYRVNAISGRGIVRNYDGSPGDTLPTAYPHLLFDRKALDMHAGWEPQVIVIALGTNDFSTALRAGEPWPDRAALHAAYEERYVRFVQDLRAGNRHAHFILWATEAHQGEIASQVHKVAERLRALGESRLTYLPVTGLDFAACHAHPSLADDARIAELIGTVIDEQKNLWRRQKPITGVAAREPAP